MQAKQNQQSRSTASLSKGFDSSKLEEYSLDQEISNSRARELMVLSKKLGKLNEKRAISFSNLSNKYEKLLSEYVPFTEEEEGRFAEQMVQELGDIATESIQKRNSKHLLGSSNI